MEELSLLNDLNDNGVPVSYPVRDENENYIGVIDAPEGQRFAVLFTYAEGETIRNPSAIICHEVGKAMAQMHQFTVNRLTSRKRYDADTLVNRSFSIARQRFSEHSDEMRFFQEAAKVVTEQFKNADPGLLRYGTVHLDLWYENMKITDEREVTFFDFDNCGNGWLFLDISYYLMLLFRNEPDKESYKEKAEQFYAGYESVIPVSNEEKKLIPYGGLAIWLHYSGIHVERFNDFSNHFLSEEFLKYWMNTVKQWLDFNKTTVNPSKEFSK